MRIDIYLKRARLIKQRSTAKRACDVGAVIIDARTAKPSSQVKIGSCVEITYPTRRVVVEIAALPKSNASKEEARRAYHVIREEKISRDLLFDE